MVKTAKAGEEPSLTRRVYEASNDAGRTLDQQSRSEEATWSHHITALCPKDCFKNTMFFK